MELVIQTVNTEHHKKNDDSPFRHPEHSPQQTVEPPEMNGTEKARQKTRNDIEQQGYPYEQQRISHHRAYAFRPRKLRHQP